MHWYVRQDNRISGPFPGGQISQSLLLGRMSLKDLVSKDKEEWHPVVDFPELIPDILKADPNDPQVQQRLAAARRWADERRQERRDPAEPERIVAGRRGGEDYETLEYRQTREQNMRHLKRRAERNWGALVLVVILLIGGLYAGFRYVPQQPDEPDCNAPPAPGVNWRYCNMAGLQQIKANLKEANLNSSYLMGANLFGSELRDADLAYANLAQANLSFTDLQGATLKGANLRGSDLTEANLQNADLSYANLEGAKLRQTNLENVQLDNAIWVDGSQCQAKSLGRCISE